MLRQLSYSKVPLYNDAKSHKTSRKSMEIENIGKYRNRSWNAGKPSVHLSVKPP